MEPRRRPFQGVLNILSFNRHFYSFGWLALLAFLSSRQFIEWPDAIFWAVVAAFAYGMIVPLLVSAYVYDFSGYYKLGWLKHVVPNVEEVKLAVNINAGFDETSFIIQRRLPGAEIRVFDFYNAKQHTEPAIKRARKVSMVYPNTQSIASGAIPLPDNTVNVVFLLSAAHEIRTHDERVTLLRECYRVCRPTGKVVMVEHLRDLPNFLAFTIGFTHFFSSASWKKAFRAAGFNSVKETKFTPFMSIFNCSR